MRKERVGFAVCGSFCTHEKVLEALEELVKLYETVIPIASEASAFTDTRFGTSEKLLEQLRPDCLCVDLASVQGIDLAAAEDLGLPCVWARSLPGRLVPRTAASVIRDAVDHILEERGDPA